MSTRKSRIATATATGGAAVTTEWYQHHDEGRNDKRRTVTQRHNGNRSARTAAVPEGSATQG